MRFYILTVLLLSFSSAQANDQTYDCRRGDAWRLISVQYLYVEEKLPCEVRYQKEGSETVLWTAQKQLGYCEAKAKRFVEKHKGWGWSCELLQNK